MKKWIFFSGIFLILFLRPTGVYATIEQELESTREAVQAKSAADEKKTQDALTKDYLATIREELNLEYMDDFTEQELPEKTSFSDIVNILLEEGFDGIDKKSLMDWGLDLFFYELSAAKPLFIRMLLCATLFSVINRFFVTGKKYSGDISFLFIYGAMMILLLQSFLLVGEIVEDGINLVCSFMKTLIPVYATTLLLSGSAVSAGAFYELTFGIILALEWAVKVFLIPGIHIFVLLTLLDHLLEEERFSRLAELIESGERLFLKLAVSGVIGFSVVQSLLTPARDRISQSTFLKTLSVLPGVGGGFEFAEEVVLSCGMLVKNCVGVAGLVILLVICITPVIKVAAIHFLYKILAAALQPVSDRRIVKGIADVSRGSALYLKIMTDTMLLFLIAIAMVTASTSFVY